MRLSIYNQAFKNPKKTEKLTFLRLKGNLQRMGSIANYKVMGTIRLIIIIQI